MDKPDALFLPSERKTGASMFERTASISDVAEPILGIDRAKGHRAHIRLQGNKPLFITASPTDTLFFPTGHPRSGQSRYRWELQSDGSRWGYLVEGATPGGEIADREE